MIKGASYFKNRKLNFSEQFSHWKSNWRNGVLRLVERILTGRNVSDLLGGNLIQIQHLPEVRSQLVEIIKINKGEVLDEISIAPVSGDYQFVINEVIQPQLLLQMKNLKVDIKSGLSQLESGFVVDSTLAQWQRLLYRGGMSHSVSRLSRSLPFKNGTWIVLPFSPYYFHTLIEDIPLILEARRYNREVRVLTSYQNPDWTFEILKLMNIDVEISMLKAIEFENYLAVTAPRGISKNVVKIIRSQVEFVRSEEKKRIFLSRGFSLDRADVGLEAAVMERLSSLGFELVNPSNMSVPEQVKLFALAEIVIGTHGGALTNIVWAEPGTHVIELFNHPYRTQDFARLATACNHRYSCIEASHELTDKAVASLIYDLVSQS